MTMRRGKLTWESASLNVICDRCGKPRNCGDHMRCSEGRKRARSREAAEAVKAELMRLMQN